MRRPPLVLAAVLALSGCTRPAPRDDFPGPTARAEFGVFFGGQVQERDRIPLELDRAVQTVGFRLDFDQPLPQAVKVGWELDMPGNTRGVRDVQGRIGRGRLVRVDEVQVPAGRERYEQTLAFHPGDPLGTWNVRVRVDGAIVIDRPFEVVRP